MGILLHKYSLVGQGSTGNVHAINKDIVVKVPRALPCEQFQNEIRILEILSCRLQCPQIIRAYFWTTEAIFLERLDSTPLYNLLQENLTWKPGAFVVAEVHRLEPLEIHRSWMHDLALAVVHLDGLGIAHGDIAPWNILITADRHLKLIDFDCAAAYGTEAISYFAPWGRLLGDLDGDEDAGQHGRGMLGLRTETFALGSIFYFINYGYPPYLHVRDVVLDDIGDHDGWIEDKFQRKEFPALNTNDHLVSAIIERCWHGRYKDSSDLVRDTRNLGGEGSLARSEDVSEGARMSQ